MACCGILQRAPVFQNLGPPSGSPCNKDYDIQESTWETVTSSGCRTDEDYIDVMNVLALTVWLPPGSRNLETALRVSS